MSALAAGRSAFGLPGAAQSGGEGFVPGVRRSARSRAALTLLLTLPVLTVLWSVTVGCRQEEPASPPRTVILISLDTLRKDAIGVYRGDTPGDSNTPALDSFARDAVVIDGARSPMPFTLPAHISLLTGVAPRVHGVSRRDRSLSAELGTLPEWLRAAGFETHGVAVNYWMKGAFGFERGFDSYELVKEGLVSSGRVNAALGKILDGAPGRPEERDASRSEHRSAGNEGVGRKLFVFAQYFDVHSASARLSQNTLPYYSPPEYRDDLAASFGDDEFCDEAMGCATGFLAGANASGRHVEEATLARVRALYARSVRHQDAQLAEFMQELKRRELYDEALIVVTSDHGEAFREHGRFLHSQTYEETIAIPLLVKLPATQASTQAFGRAGKRVVGLAMLEDIAPTILDLLGLPPSVTAQGVSLLPLIRAGEPARSWAVSQDKSRRSRHALVAEGFKLIHDFEGGASELYDLTADPLERQDLSSAQPQRAASLLRQLAEQVEQNTRLAKRFRAAASRALLSDDEQAALRAIGYVED